MHRLKEGPKVIGTKQTLRALEREQASVLYIAKDAQPKVTVRVLDMAKSQNLPIVYVETMDELGSVCNVEVKTATAALIK